MNVFVAGPRVISRLNNNVKKRLTNIIEQNFKILVGDANGIDKQIQLFCHENNYNNVKVFASNGKARNNIGLWDVENVKVAHNVRGFDFYVAKDLEMAKNADYGFMIWNGKSKGTLNNIINLVKFNKQVLVYFIPHKQFYKICSVEDIEEMKNGTDGSSNINHSGITNKCDQLSLFN